ncbi:MAG: hypothetical protein GX663_00225 [Clostridiales bacterium]|nr:hypothetical protein [Clostridiales bacterium]
MSNIIKSPTHLSMYILKEYIEPGDILIDATCGNGKDTLYLAMLKPSKLYAFDIQEEAIDTTRKLLMSQGYAGKLEDGTISLLQTSHINIPFYVKRGIKAIVFNLGYRPGGDKSITTSAENTVKAVKFCLNLLQNDGIICITMYSGHQEGTVEKDLLLTYTKGLDPTLYHVAYFNMLNQPNHPPEILFITKK